MESYPEHLKTKLDNMIHDLSQYAWLFAKDPKRDFTRSRKLSFEEMLRLLLGMGGGNLTKELLDHFKFSPETASSSAFIQQREKILPDALEFLFHEFTCSCEPKKMYRGYRLLAVDGSDLLFAGNPKDSDSYYQPRSDRKGYNMLHLNALYDICSHLYLDAVIQPGKHQDEHQALSHMVDRAQILGRVIILADRGFEGYNTLAHIQQKGWNYVIRIKDSWGGILQGLSVPDTPEFDIRLQFSLVRKNTSAIRAIIREHPEEMYRRITSNTRFDFLTHSSQPFYPFDFRVVRVQTMDGKFETLITNLDEAAFPPSELRNLYHMRWGIETSFRSLKYTIGLSHFHTKKQEYIMQEVFARLTMYNFAQIITMDAVQSEPCSKKLAYQINFSIAAYICRMFFRSAIPNLDILAFIAKFMLPVRPGRSHPRYLKSKSPAAFIYRVT